MASEPGSSGPVSLVWTLWYRVSHILNMAREIDNFFPERFTYHNVRVWDEESAQLLPHWKETHRFIEDARWAPPSLLPQPQLPAETAALLLPSSCPAASGSVSFTALSGLTAFLCWVPGPYPPLPSLHATGVAGEWTDPVPPP